jgi:hypothetical protein
MEAGREVGIDLPQRGVGIGKGFEGGPQPAVDGDGRNEPPLPGTQVEGGAAGQEHGPPLPFGGLGQAHEVRGGERLVGVAHVDAPMGDASAVRLRDLGGADVHAAVHLHGVHRDHDGAGAIGDAQRKVGLAGAGGADEDERFHARWNRRSNSAIVSEITTGRPWAQTEKSTWSSETSRPSISAIPRRWPARTLV